MMGVSFLEINQACPSSGLIRHDGKRAFWLNDLGIRCKRTGPSIWPFKAPKR